MKTQILNSMIDLIKEGHTIAGTNENDFSEFAEVNGYSIEDVNDVYNENEEMLTEIYLNNQ